MVDGHMAARSAAAATPARAVGMAVGPGKGGGEGVRRRRWPTGASGFHLLALATMEGGSRGAAGSGGNIGGGGGGRSAPVRP